MQVPLAANEVRQFNVIRDLALGNVYNGRIAVRVISGDGRVTAFASLIDELTGDPTVHSRTVNGVGGWGIGVWVGSERPSVPLTPIP